MLIGLWEGVRTARLWKDDGGQDLIEYVLIAAFLAAAFATVTPVIADAAWVFSKVNMALSAAAQ